MLDAAVTTRISEYIRAETKPRARNFAIALRDLQAGYNARGVLQSSIAVLGYAQAGRDELAVRAGIVWTAVRRSHQSMVGAVNDQTLANLRQQVEQHISEHADPVAAMACSKVKWGETDRWHKTIRESISERSGELIAGIDVEIQFYIDSLQRAEREREQQAAPGMIFNAPVGAIQTGDYATAHVSLGQQDRERLVDALAQLRTAIEQNKEIGNEQRVQAIDIANDTIEEAESDTPNAPKIAGLLGGIGQTIRTVGSLRGAWGVVRDVAIAIGWSVS